MMRDSTKRGIHRKEEKTSTWIQLSFSLCVHACVLCSNLFSQGSNPRIHIVAYLGEKPFTCPQCDHSSRTKSALRVHLLTHSGGWSTSVNDAANHSANLKIWKLTLSLTPEKTYKCKRCNYLTTTKAAMGVGTPYELSLWRKTARLHTMQFCNSTKKSTGISHAHSHGRKSIQVHKMKLFNKNKTSTEISPALGCLCFLIWMFFFWEKSEGGGKGGRHRQSKKMHFLFKKAQWNFQKLGGRVI